MSAFLEGETETPAKPFATGALVVVTETRGRRVKMAQAGQRDEIDEIAVRFAAMPAFPLAVREYIVTMTGMRQRFRLLHKVISHNARWRVAAFLMYLSADRERFGPMAVPPTPISWRCAGVALKSNRVCSRPCSPCC